jgi:3-oxoacyl-[acyl-carrier protein] reductase
VRADVSDEGDVRRLVETVVRELGDYNVLINNAGFGWFAPLLDITVEKFRRVWETNVLGAMLVARESARHFVAKGTGNIVNVASTAGLGSEPGQSPEYAAAKAGLIGFTKATARELAHWQILVNAVAPGLVDTEMAAAISPEAREALLAQIPLGRMGTPREVAEMVGFLAGEGAAYITGQVFHVNGGLYI